LQDDFEAPALSSRWHATSEYHTTVDVMNGSLCVLFDDPMAEDAHGWITSEHAYDLRGGELAVAVTSMLNPDNPAAAATFFVNGPNGDFLRFRQQGAELFFERQDERGLRVESIPWDAGAQRDWRFREAGGT